MCQLLELAIKCPRTILLRCRAWLTSTLRNYPGFFLKIGFICHVLSLVTLSAYAVYLAFIIIDIDPFPTDSPKVVATYVAMVIVTVMNILMFLLFLTRSIRYKNGFKLGLALILASAITTIAVCWAFDLGSLLAWMSSAVYLASTFLYIIPAIVHKCSEKRMHRQHMRRQHRPRRRQQQQHQRQQQQQQQQQQQHQRQQQQHQRQQQQRPQQRRHEQQRLPQQYLPPPRQPRLYQAQQRDPRQRQHR